MSGSEVRSAPYLHATVDQVFEPTIAGLMAEQLARIENWQHHKGGFFEQYELDVLRFGPQELQRMLSPDVLDALRERVGELLMADLQPDVKVIAHRMTAGQGVAIHNDEPIGDAETHRLVVYLGEFSDDLAGGHLVVLSAPEIAAIDRVLRPTHNAGFCFAMSASSHHAVTEVREGMRHSLVFSFWRTKGDAVAGFDEIAHSGGSLGDHLRGTYELLRQWAVPETVCLAGLLHSGYGTEHLVADHDPSETDRARVRAVVGPEAERLAWLFATCTRDSIITALESGRLLRHRDGVDVPVDRDTVVALLLIDLANTVEQLPRVPADRAELDAELERFEAVAGHLPAAGIVALKSVISVRSH